jgi:hypothetical protein
MQIFFRVVGAFSIVLVSFFATLLLMNYFSPLCPQGETVFLKQPFAKQGTLWFYAPAPQLSGLSDTAEAPRRSPAVVCENSRPLGPAHTQHGEIAAKGSGRFSHTGLGFYFSSSDNSDPNTNGRTYRVVVDRNGQQ